MVTPVKKTVVSGDELVPSAQALLNLHTAMQPFVKRLSKNSGDALIKVEITFAEKNRQPPPDVPTTNAPKHTFKLTQPFKIMGPEITGVLGLPCPLCKAGSGHPCEPIGSTGPHSQRTSLWVAYFQLSPEGLDEDAAHETFRRMKN